MLCAQPAIKGIGMAPTRWLTGAAMSESLSSGISSSFSVSPVVASEFLSGGSDSADAILTRARERAAASKLGYAGNVTPQEAWELVSAHAAVVIDVRTAEERQFVGRIPDSIHVPWLIGGSLQRNPRFVREVEGKVRRDDVLLLICRSGARSAAAAAALAEARFRNAWRFHRLPWIQD
jgi:rhodanese-related sulfurtransferase